MVVVLVVITRATAATEVETERFRENERARYMALIVADGPLHTAYGFEVPSFKPKTNAP
jgi:hypothetical protein